MIEFDVDVDLLQVARVMEALRTEIPSVPIMRDMGELLRTQSQQHLASGDQRDPVSGQAWPEWSQAYRDAGAPFSGDHRMLVRDGDLLNSIRVGRVTKTKTAAGSDLRYAATNQRTRPYLGASPEDEDELVLAFAAHVEEVIRRAA